MKDQPTEKTPDLVSSTEAYRPVVLIANVGSRNLSFHGKELKEYFDSRNNPDYAHWHFQVTNKFGRVRWHFDFRGVTEYLLAHYEEVKEELSSQIFDYLLTTNSRRDVHTVLLIGSNQTDKAHQHTDTLFAAELLKKLLLEDETVEQVETMVATGVNPTHEAELFAFLPSHLRGFIGEHPEATFRFCDAGGTPQMKSVVKELCSYYLPANRLDIRYLPDDEDVASREVLSPLHDKYVLLGVARRFVQRYDYASALHILKELPAVARVGESLFVLLRIAAARLRFDHGAAVQANALISGTGLPAVFTNYLHKQPGPGVLDFPEDLPGDLPRFDVQEIASLCQLYLLILKNYTLGIPTYYRLCEELGQNIAEDRALPQRLSLSDGRQSASWVSQHAAVAQSHANLRAEFGLPFLLAYAMEHTNPSEMQPLVREMHGTISILNGRGAHSGLNKLRNRCFLAHQNQSVTAQAIEAECHGFLGEKGRASRIFQYMGMPTTNVYDQMNIEILALFDQE